METSHYSSYQIAAYQSILHTKNLLKLTKKHFVSPITACRAIASASHSQYCWLCILLGSLALSVGGGQEHTHTLPHTPTTHTLLTQQHYVGRTRNSRRGQYPGGVPFSAAERQRGASRLQVYRQVPEQPGGELHFDSGKCVVFF